MHRPSRTPATYRIEGLPTIFANAAGMDIGADEIVVAVPPDRDAEPIRAFRTFTPDLEALVIWLLECGIDTVAMESTGVYWIPIYRTARATWDCALSGQWAPCQERAGAQE